MGIKLGFMILGLIMGIYVMRFSLGIECGFTVGLLLLNGNILGWYKINKNRDIMI